MILVILVVECSCNMAKPPVHVSVAGDEGTTGKRYLFDIFSQIGKSCTE